MTDLKQKLTDLDLPQFLLEYRVKLDASKTTDYVADYGGFREYAYQVVKDRLTDNIKSSEEEVFISSLLFAAAQWNQFIMPDDMMDCTGEIIDDPLNMIDLLKFNNTWVLC